MFFQKNKTRSPDSGAWSKKFRKLRNMFFLKKRKKNMFFKKTKSLYFRAGAWLKLRSPGVRR